MNMNTPIRPKVLAATLGAGAGATISAFVLWLLGVLVWRAHGGAPSATVAVAAVPGPVSGVVLLAVTLGLTFAAGYTKSDGTGADTAPAADPGAAGSAMGDWRKGAGSIPAEPAPASEPKGDGTATAEPEPAGELPDDTDDNTANQPDQPDQPDQPAAT